jgi:hypothetical protein
MLFIPSVDGNEQFSILWTTLKFCHNAGRFHQARKHQADGNRLPLSNDPH